MAFNFAGFPIGSALTGWLATRSVEAAIAFGAVACLGAAAITRLGLPGTSAPASQAARRA
jgi:biotin transporter BioY